MPVDKTADQLIELRLNDCRRAIKEEIRLITEHKAEAMRYSMLGLGKPGEPVPPETGRLYVLAIEALHDRINAAYGRLGSRFAAFVQMGGMIDTLPELAEFSEDASAAKTVLSLLK